MSSIEPYNAEKFKLSFKKTPIYNKLIEEFKIVEFDKHWLANECRTATPRERLGRIAKTTAIPFYFLEWLNEINSEKIYDLGCGWNIFKKYYNNIIGVDTPQNPNDQFFYADLHDFVDDDYIQGHQSYFDAVFSICALHFIPLSSLRKRVMDFESMIKPQGRGWLSLNAMRMIETDEKFKNTDMLDIENYCKEQLANLPNSVMVSVDLTVLDESIDGNIHICFEKSYKEETLSGNG